jgi:serine kinase of HPr protein (carbohydrate metabolism regulator)
MTAETLHAGLVAIRVRRSWAGVLIRGPSGSGKSSLALRALSQGFRLVADDRVIVWRHRGRVFGRAPESLKGLLEVHGVGISTESSVDVCAICLIVDCQLHPHDIERMPDYEVQSLQGCKIPQLGLWPPDPFAPEKLFKAIMHLGERL